MIKDQAEQKLYVYPSPCGRIFYNFVGLSSEGVGIKQNFTFSNMSLLQHMLLIYSMSANTVVSPFADSSARVPPNVYQWAINWLFEHAECFIQPKCIKALYSIFTPCSLASDVTNISDIDDKIL